MQPIKTALCSFGMSGWVFHAPFIAAHPGFRLQGVWERSKQLAKEKYPQSETYRSLEELLAADVELVVVNTPNDTHYSYAKQALEAGKHVIVEKPFTPSVEEANDLIQIAARQGRLLSVFHNRRYDSDFKTATQILHSGLLGDITEAEIHYDRYKLELSPKLHKEVPAPYNGSLFDLGSHLADQALQLFGKPEAVFADCRIVRPASGVIDYFDLLLYYPSLRVRVKGSYLVREPLPAYVIHGTKGSFLKTRADVQEVALQAGISPDTNGWGVEPDTERGLLHTEKDGEVIKEKVPTLKGNYMEYYNKMYEAIRNNESLPATAEDGLEVVRLIQAANRSDKEQRVVRMDETE